MAEELALTTPEVTSPVTNTGYRVAYLGFRVLPAGSAEILVHLLGDNGERVEVRTTDAAEATTLMHALNTANLSTKSLERRCLEWCATKVTRLTGSVTGTPD